MKLLRTLIVVGFVLVPVLAQAQFDPHLIPNGGRFGACDFNTIFDGRASTVGWDCIPVYIAFLIQTVFGFIGTLCLIQIIWAGYEMAISSVSGDKEAGKNRLQRAIIGLVFSMFVYLIVNMVVSVVI